MPCRAHCAVRPNRVGRISGGAHITLDVAINLEELPAIFGGMDECLGSGSTRRPLSSLGMVQCITSGVGTVADRPLLGSATVPSSGGKWVASGPTALSGMMATTGNGSYAEP